ncbi:carboxypeptidase-like regulatory domain-containing protein [Thiohalomonas denitrificans]|uniref:Carboxypeptidase regulatory-like domain-containing protein n=1 Tax=Thiohalomonas denitrificans TaxID=415747 RepID=A0A1G5QE03_9GAMM|nr:carboxypeptidase-like regulatory domain-containing protein [Thiohalomonas denitrificans]SCZ59878.1 hypothetical protein SAMN03097708_01943 [Thiohalomonas denitrificans]
MRWFALFLLLFLEPVWAFTAPVVRIEVTVTDESGAPVPDARVGAVYYGATDHYTDVELTDEKGIAVVSGRTVYAVPFSVSKLGYYPGGKKIMPPADETEAGPKKVAVVLRKKRNLIPLYAIKYSGEIPIAEEWIGFDLEKADWVSPYGKGVITDFELMYEGYMRSFWDAKGTLKLRFSSQGDGLIDVSEQVYAASRMRLSHLAPQRGYSDAEKWWALAMSEDVDEEHKPSRRKHYFLRVRSRTNDAGELVSANYTKIYGDIRFFFKTKKGGAAGVAFDYYFNPTPNDRNLEFAVGRNLFENLEHEQQVREP